MAKASKGSKKSGGPKSAGTQGTGSKAHGGINPNQTQKGPTGGRSRPYPNR